MRIYTGTIVVNNGKFDRVYRYRVFASSFGVGMYRAIRTTEREFKKAHRGQRIISMRPGTIEQSKPIGKVDPPDLIPSNWVDRAWIT